MGTLPGVYEAKKDGSLYYRTSITYHSKHISIGSYNKEEAANAAYREARKLLDTNTLYSPDDYHPDDFPHLSYQKWICLINFKNNGFYIKTPIYLYQKFFSYHLSPSDILLFDADDLFTIQSIRSCVEAIICLLQNMGCKPIFIPVTGSKILPEKALTINLSMVTGKISVTAI